MQLTSDIFDDVHSLFIADRLHETRWQHRQYILDLLQLARYIERNGPHSFAEAIRYKQLVAAYPTEHRALELEYQEGRHVSTEEFQHMKDEDHRQRAADTAEQLQRDHQVRWQQHQELVRAFHSWRKVGGQP